MIKKSWIIHMIERIHGCIKISPIVLSRKRTLPCAYWYNYVPDSESESDEEEIVYY